MCRQQVPPFLFAASLAVLILVASVRNAFGLERLRSWDGAMEYRPVLGLRVETPARNVRLEVAVLVRHGKVSVHLALAKSASVPSG